MEPHEDPVENAISEAIIKVTAGSRTGLNPPESIVLVMKSAVCNSSVTRASAHASTRIMMAPNIVLKPFNTASIVELNVRIP